jgi:hypothetical protein
MGFGRPWSARAQRDLAWPPLVLTILPLHKHGQPACHRIVHIPSGLWALLTLFLTKSSQILRKVGTARVPPGSGEWCLGARILGARLQNLGWHVCGGAQFEDRPQSNPCQASLPRKSGDALTISNTWFTLKTETILRTKTWNIFTYFYGNLAANQVLDLCG